MTSESTFDTTAQIAPHHLVQPNGAGTLQHTVPFDLQNFVPQVNIYENADRRFSTLSTNSAQNPYQIHTRRPSQQELVGSPASSYTPSLSDGRRGSMSYPQTSFKVPTNVPLESRMSLPVATAQLDSTQSTNNFAGQQGITRDMHNSQWTPNFSFGAPSSADNMHAARRNQDQYKNYMQHMMTSTDAYAMPSDRLNNYNFDRRMSHPVLSSGSFDVPAAPVRTRQASAVDWRTYNNPAQNRRPTTADSLSAMHNVDGLWNTLDSARGMVAMSNQGQLQNLNRPRPDAVSDGTFKQQISRRRSMPYITGSSVINEDPHGESIDSYEGSGMFGNTSLDLSDDGSAPIQSILGSDGRQDQASMMTTFNAKDTNSGHKKHVCPVCKKRFTRPSSLTTHIYSHTGEKPFICEVDGCGRHFSVISNLRRHKKIHAQAGIMLQPDNE